MSKEVIISIKGVQDAGNGKDSVEFITSGKLTRKGDHYYISYREDEESDFKGALTTLKLEGDTKLTITRAGRYKSQLILEKGTRQLGYYETEYGELVMGTKVSDIKSEMTELGGFVSVDYSLEINHSLASENSFYITVREAGNNDDKSNPVS